ncbi:MAG TPA: RNA polymerase sigma factor [Ferruginibacter sp.]|nr:RNA polymerase sigma factor [Ferruginibacter sp.]HRE62717.1 RNA polymerase sigma factor [Ferruginibacter sp.]
MEKSYAVDQLQNLKELIEKSLGGDHKAFKVLYDSLSGKMYSLCLRYISDREDANDVFQDSFAKLYFNLPHFRFEGSFEGWARRIFVTCCLDFLKKKKIAFVEITENINIEANGLSGIDKLEKEDMFKVILQLPEGQRTVFNLYQVEGYSHQEIADMLQISASGSKSQLHRAKSTLKNLLTHENG